MVLYIYFFIQLPSELLRHILLDVVNEEGDGAFLHLFQCGKKSTMWDQGLEGTDSGLSNPSWGRLEVLPRAQIEQAKMISFIASICCYGNSEKPE